MNKHPQWRRVGARFPLPCVRPGWPGVWDAIKAAVRNTPRLATPTPMSISMCVLIDPDQQIGFHIDGIALEQQPIPLTSNEAMK